MYSSRLLKERLGVEVTGSAGAPTVLLLRAPAWLGNRVRHPENCVPPLDLGVCVALAREAGYQAFLLDLETEALRPEDVHECLARDRPEVVCLNGVTAAHTHLLRWAEAARAARPDARILACGQHADAVPEAFLFPGSPVDLCLVGEFEETLAEVLARHRDGADLRIPGTRSWEEGAVRDHGPRTLVQPLDRLPDPDHAHFRSARYRYLHPLRAIGPFRWGFLQSSRGCPYPCIYCSRTLRNSFGRTYRWRSPERVVSEMRHLQRLGANALVFLDDVFNYDRDRVLALCDAIRRAGLRLPWKAEGRVRPADRELFASLRAAGCTTFSMGVESGSQRILDRLQKRTTVAEAERAFALARGAGLITVGFFLVGAPGETRADFEQTRQLLRRIDPDLIQVAWFTCYPGSAAFERYHREQPLAWERYQHYEDFVNLTAEDDATVRSWQSRLYRDFLFRPRYVFRHLRLRHVNLLLNFRTEWFLAQHAVHTLLRRRRGG